MFARTRAWLRRQNELHRACIRESLAEGLVYARSLDKRKLLKQCFARRWLGWWALLAVVTAVSIVLSIYHDRMVEAIRPWARKILHTKGAWLVPIAALVVVSVPPLVGHEIIILAVGIIWGLAWGFLIAIAGTWLGEILCFYLFKYFFREKAKKIEMKSYMYASLADIMRRDGLWMVSLVRFSAIPGHITTAIQSCIGISIWVYGIAAAISLPKQLALVYLGVLFGESHRLPAEQTSAGDIHGNSVADSNRKHTIVTWSVLCITGWATFMAFYIIWFRIWQVRKQTEAAKLDQEMLSSGVEGSVVAVDPAAASTSSGSILDDKETPGRYGYADSHIEYFTTASSGNRTPAPSYREQMTEMFPRTKASNSTLSSANPFARPTNPRSRSSTLVSLAFSNNSLPYLPYTPMVELPNQLPASAETRMPTRVPTAVVPSSPRIEEDLDFSGSDLESQDHHHYPQPSGSYTSYTDANQAGNASGSSDVSVRLRRVRLARSNSNLLLRSSQSTDNLVEGVTRPSSPLADANQGRPRSRSRSSTLAISTLPPYPHQQGNSSTRDRAPSQSASPRVPLQIPEAHNEDAPTSPVAQPRQRGNTDGQ